MQKIGVCLWFDNQAEEAASFYTSIFKDSKLGAVTHYGAESVAVSGQPAGSVMTVAFEIDGQPFLALNGGPTFNFSEAISLVVPCATQAELDYYWEKLSEGGDPEAQVCGWLKDKFGVSWQIVPAVLDELLARDAEAGRGGVMTAVLQMKKLDIAELERAAAGE